MAIEAYIHEPGFKRQLIQFMTQSGGKAKGYEVHEKN